MVNCSQRDRTSGFLKLSRNKYICDISSKIFLSFFIRLDLFVSIMIVCKVINGVQIVKNKQSFLKTNIKISPHLAREQLSQLLVYLQLEPVLKCHTAQRLAV